MLALFSDKEITMRIGGQRLRAIKMFHFDGIKSGENQRDLAKRFIKHFLLNGLRIVEGYKARTAREEAICCLPIINEVNVPEDSIT